MSPAKLKLTQGHFRKLFVRAKTIARNDSRKISPKQFGQDFASPGGIDFEHRKIVARPAQNIRMIRGFTLYP